MSSPLTGPPPQPAVVGQPGTQSSPPPGDPTAASGDQSLQLVTRHLMEAKQSLQEASKIKPELAALVDKFVNEVEPQAGQILFGGGQQSQMPQPSLMGMLAGGAGPMSTHP
jgi:hypothetical protein